MPFKPPLERLKHLYVHIYIYLIYFWLSWVFRAASSLLGLSVVSVSWGSPFAAVHELTVVASLVAEHRL